MLTDVNADGSDPMQQQCFLAKENETLVFIVLFRQKWSIEHMPAHILSNVDIGMDRQERILLIIQLSIACFRAS